MNDILKIISIAQKPQSREMCIQFLPRPLLEAVALIAFCILIFVLLLLEVERSQILILIGVIFFASIKLLPSVSNIIKSLQSLKYNSASVDAVYNELKSIKKKYKEIR